MTETTLTARQVTPTETSKLTEMSLRTSGVTGAISVEPEDLSRFEGEGGPEAPALAAEFVDVPLENAIWRRPSTGQHIPGNKNR